MLSPRRVLGCVFKWYLNTVLDLTAGKKEEYESRTSIHASSRSVMGRKEENE